MDNFDKRPPSNSRNNHSFHTNYDLVCFSHLRWDFVYQRPQHLMSRFACARRVFFFEEPVFSDEPSRLDISEREDNLFIVVPRVSHGDKEKRDVSEIQRELLKELFDAQKINEFVLWFYTPMALTFADHLQPLAIVYDCMDELSAFKFAPRALHENEAILFERADLVFTGGQSIYEAKRSRHERVYAFPSSIDVEHFAQARAHFEEPTDQKSIASPKLGFCGVIDERMDIALLDETAHLRPDWQFVMIGPVVKIDEADLPKRENIHYLGGKSYQELPAYIAGWDVATMPFAINESTRFISPTKTPEYLAAGKPVVSTPIRDVVRPYGEMGLVHIASTAEEFVAAAEKAMHDQSPARMRLADDFLARNSWDKTWQQMSGLISEIVNLRSTRSTVAKNKVFCRY